LAGKSYRAKITEIREIEGGIVLLRFMPQHRFHYDAGQFLSLQVPDQHNSKESVWRAYSYSLPPEIAKEQGYELCIKRVEGGQTNAYLNHLKVGDWINIRSSYGDFKLKTEAGRGVALIGTGTGVAPLRSIALSNEIQNSNIDFAVAILGFRTFNEIPYPGDFERAGIATTYALSKIFEKPLFPFFKGRVTDVLKQLRPDFPWQTTDFYVCGSGEMIREVVRLLQSAHGVKDSAIIAEAFEPAQSSKKAA
jgi:NAD(P)H-flavin reductase